MTGTTGANAPSDLQRGKDKAGRRAIVDLRSDTVTLPTPAMYERMRTAPLGDDGLDGDPTARELEALVARTLGKAAALYVPTATMGNLLAVLSQSERQGQVVLESTAHMLVSERGGATLSGLAYLGIGGTAGAMDVGMLTRTLRGPGALRTALVCMETSHANAGGAVLPLDHMNQVFDTACASGVRVHLDGARLFNAAVALDVAPAAIASFADSVTVCLSKGLAAPAGAVLAGPAATIVRARRLRKMLGGTQRQIGVLAATGLEAIESMAGRLADDHLQARSLAGALAGIRPDRLRTNTPQTNIVLVDLPADGPDSEAWTRELQEHGVLVRPWGPHRLRLVTHRHIDAASVDAAVAGFLDATHALLA